MRHRAENPDTDDRSWQVLENHVAKVERTLGQKRELEQKVEVDRAEVDRRLEAVQGISIRGNLRSPIGVSGAAPVEKVAELEHKLDVLTGKVRVLDLAFRILWVFIAFVTILFVFVFILMSTR